MSLKKCLRNGFFQCRHAVAYCLPDEIYLKILYRVMMGKPLDVTHPQTLNEKTQWLKLHDRNPVHITMADKYAVRDYVGNIIGKEFLIPLLGVWDKVEDIDFDSLPDKFVLKPTHDSGSAVICLDKASFDRGAAAKKLDNALKTNYYKVSRERPYKYVPRRIIAEKYIDDGGTTGLTDYKLFCFNGKVKCSFTGTGRFLPGGVRMNYFDRDWNLMPVKRFHENDPVVLPRPKFYDTMISIAEKLAENEIFMRVDLYETEKQVYFGEITLFPSGGFDKFEPESYDLLLGSWLKLPIDEK